MISSSPDRLVISRYVPKFLVLALILIAGIAYNIAIRPYHLAMAFTPFGLPVGFGWAFVTAGVIVAVLTAIRFYGFLREPVIASVYAEGLELRGLDIIPWGKIQKMWYGALTGKQQDYHGTFLFVEFAGSAETMNPSLHKFGLFPEKLTKSGRAARIRYWVPFLLPSEKEEFINTVRTYCPHLEN